MDSIILEVKVIPNAKHYRVDSFEETKLNNYKMKLRVSASPTDGKANEAVIKLLADFLGVTKSQIGIISGWSSRQKRIKVTNTDKSKLQGRLQLSLC